MEKRTRYILMALSLLLSIGTGWWMYSSYLNNNLWGYWPLLLLTSSWMFITIGLLPRYSKHKNNTKRYLLATLSAVLLWLGFPMIPLTPLLFIAFVPLLLVEDDIARSKPGAGKAEVFRYSYHTFVLWNILTTYWVANTTFAAGILAFLANSLFMCIPFVAFHQLKKTMGTRLGWMAFVAFWITFEYLHLRQELTWPWLTLGNSFATFPSLVQWYSYTGVFGGSLWILTANVLLYPWLAPKLSRWFKLEQSAEAVVVSKKKMPLGNWINLALLMILPVLISLGMYFTHTEKGDSREIVIVQPNLEPHYVKFNMTNEQTMQQFLKLSSEAIGPETEYLVFPETSFGDIRTNNFKTDRQINTLQRFVDGHPKLKLVTGLDTKKIYKDGEEHGHAVRIHVRNNGDTLFWENHNSAIQLTSGGEEIDFYLKSKLVPGAEIFPYHKLLFFIKPIVRELGGSPSGFATQEKRSAFHGGGTAVAPVICYESIFGEYCTDYVKRNKEGLPGAEAIFIVTNDGWWDNTAGHRQHLAFAQLRAIETRRSIARSANSGISAFINQRGDVLQTTKYDEEATLKGSIQFNKEITFYTVWGDLIGRIAGFVTILLVLNGIAKGLMKNKK